MLLNCGFATIKFSGNNPLERSVPPAMICPAGCTVPMLVVLRSRATAAKSPFAINVRNDAFSRNAWDPEIVVPTTPLRFSGEDAAVPYQPSSGLSADTAAILEERLSLDAKQIEELRAEQVL